MLPVHGEAGGADGTREPGHREEAATPKSAPSGNRFSPFASADARDLPTPGGVRPTTDTRNSEEGSGGRHDPLHEARKGVPPAKASDAAATKLHSKASRQPSTPSEESRLVGRYPSRRSSSSSATSDPPLQGKRGSYSSIPQSSKSPPGASPSSIHSSPSFGLAPDPSTLSTHSHELASPYYSPSSFPTSPEQTSRASEAAGNDKGRGGSEPRPLDEEEQEAILATGETFQNPLLDSDSGSDSEEDEEERLSDANVPATLKAGPSITKQPQDLRKARSVFNLRRRAHGAAVPRKAEEKTPPTVRKPSGPKPKQPMKKAASSSSMPQFLQDSKGEESEVSREEGSTSGPPNSLMSAYSPQEIALLLEGSDTEPESEHSEGEMSSEARDDHGVQPGETTKPNPPAKHAALEERRRSIVAGGQRSSSAAAPASSSSSTSSPASSSATTEATTLASASAAHPSSAVSHGRKIHDRSPKPKKPSEIASTSSGTIHIPSEYSVTSSKRQQEQRGKQPALVDSLTNPCSLDLLCCCGVGAAPLEAVKLLIEAAERGEGQQWTLQEAHRLLSQIVQRENSSAAGSFASTGHSTAPSSPPLPFTAYSAWSHREPPPSSAIPPPPLSPFAHRNAVPMFPSSSPTTSRLDSSGTRSAAGRQRLLDFPSPQSFKRMGAVARLREAHKAYFPEQKQEGKERRGGSEGDGSEAFHHDEEHRSGDGDLRDETDADEVVELDDGGFEDGVAAMLQSTKLRRQPVLSHNTPPARAAASSSSSLSSPSSSAMHPTMPALPASTAARSPLPARAAEQRGSSAAHSDGLDIVQQLRNSMNSMDQQIAAILSRRRQSRGASAEASTAAQPLPHSPPLHQRHLLQPSATSTAASAAASQLPAATNSFPPTAALRRSIPMTPIPPPLAQSPQHHRDSPEERLWRYVTGTTAAPHLSPNQPLFTPPPAASKASPFFRSHHDVSSFVSTPSPAASDACEASGNSFGTGPRLQDLHNGSSALANDSGDAGAYEDGGLGMEEGAFPNPSVSSFSSSMRLATSFTKEGIHDKLKRFKQRFSQSERRTASSLFGPQATLPPWAKDSAASSDNAYVKAVEELTKQPSRNGVGPSTATASFTSTKAASAGPYRSSTGHAVIKSPLLHSPSRLKEEGSQPKTAVTAVASEGEGEDSSSSSGDGGGGVAMTMFAKSMEADMQRFTQQYEEHRVRRLGEAAVAGPKVCKTVKYGLRYRRYVC